MRLIPNNYLAGESPSLLSRLGRGLLPLWLRGKRRQHHYRLQIRCEDRADMVQVLDLVSSTLHPAGMHPAQSMTPGRGDGRMLVLSLCPSAAIWCSSSTRSGPLAPCAGSCARTATRPHGTDRPPGRPGCGAGPARPAPAPPGTVPRLHSSRAGAAPSMPHRPVSSPRWAASNRHL